MTTSVFIRNDSPEGSDHNVAVEITYEGRPDAYSVSRDLEPGQSVTTTVYSGMQLVVREVK